MTSLTNSTDKNPLIHPWKVLSNNQVILDIEPEKNVVLPFDPSTHSPVPFTKPRAVIFFYGNRTIAEHIVNLHNQSLIQ